MLVQWVGVGVRWGWGWESSIVWDALPKDGCPLIHTVGGLEGEEGFLANTKYRETTVPPLHTLPHEKIKKRG